MKRYFLLFCWSVILLVTANKGEAQELKSGYYPDGKIRYKGYFKDGKPVGELMRYYQEGCLQAKMNYQGDTVKAVLYSRDGKYFSSGQYICREKMGKWEYWKEDCLLMSEEYRHHLLHGKSIRYGSNGCPMEQKHWQDGQLEGEWCLYYPDGKVRLQAFYVAGSLEGMLTAYSRDGKIRTKGRYKANLKEGEWVYYNGEGNLLKKQVYYSGVPENAGEQELEESHKLDSLIHAGKKIPDPAIFIDDPEAYMRMIEME